MGVRYRSATPGTLISLIAVALLAVVSFNTPLIKSLYFLSATYESGNYAGTIHLGTLGYCLTFHGQTTCTGPKVGYEFNPNELFGVSEFNIPETITKYLTYTLILHVVALAFAVASVLFGLLAHIGSLAVWCFPTCFASLASSFSLLALVFDLVIFYIAKSRIDAVSGASATIGVSVWLTLVAWIVAGVGGCAYGVGNCCMGRRQRRTSGDPNADAGYYKPSGPDDMRMQAIRDEQIRKKEQGLPSFQEYERTPLTSGGAEEEDKYMYEDAQSQPRGLNRDGSLVQGVGVGYGRRANRTPSNGQMRHRGQPDGYGNYSDLAPVPPAVSRRPSTTSGVSSAGNAGFGAGGGGVERAQPEGYGGYYGNAQHNYYDQGYSDPYQQQPYDYSNPQHDAYGQSNAQPLPQAQHFYPPQSTTPMSVPTPAPRNVSRGYNPYSGAASSDSHYNDPGPRVSQASDPYGGYDDGLGAIGMAVTSPVLDHGHQGTFGYSDQRQYPAPLQVPTPQHLVTRNNTAANLLRSPVSPGPEPGEQRRDIVGARSGGGSGYDYDEADEEEGGMRPPSYGTVAGAGTSGYQAPTHEKSGYR